VKTVLLIDDSTTIRLSISEILTKNGFHVDTASDGQSALDKLAAGVRPDLIVSDVKMPRVDGITFVRKARDLPGLRFTPILMLTSPVPVRTPEADQALRADAKTAGATGWMVKPVKPHDLVAVIRQLVPDLPEV